MPQTTAKDKTAMKPTSRNWNGNNNNNGDRSSSLDQQRPQLLRLHPTIGKIGTVAFFAVLFTFAEPNMDGYAQFRKCHGNCVNGILHAIGMPLAVSGVFLIVRAATDDPTFTRHVQTAVISAYLGLYLTFEASTVSPWIFYTLYMSIFEFLLYRRLYPKERGWSRVKYAVVGAALIAINVGALEVIGHGYYEHHHSYVLEFFNSVFHTPLYGINSVMLSSGLVPPRADHLCW